MDGMGDTWILWINNESNFCNCFLFNLPGHTGVEKLDLKVPKKSSGFFPKPISWQFCLVSFFFLVNLNVAFLVAPLCRKRLLLGYAPTHPKSAHSKSAGSWNAKCHPCAPEVMRVYPSFPSTSGSFFKWPWWSWSWASSIMSIISVSSFSVFSSLLFMSCWSLRPPNPFHCSQVRQWLQHTSLPIPVEPFRAPYSTVSYDPLNNPNNQSILHSSFGWVSKFGNPPSPSTSGLALVFCKRKLHRIVVAMGFSLQRTHLETRLTRKSSWCPPPPPKPGRCQLFLSQSNKAFWQS